MTMMNRAPLRAETASAKDGRRRRRGRSSLMVLPFDGPPATRQTTDRDGNVLMTVTLRELTAFRAKVADFMGGVSTAALYAAGAWELFMRSTDHAWIALPGLVAAWLFTPVPQKAWRWLLKKRTRTAFTVKHFALRKMLGWKVFDRQKRHCFRLIRHDKAQEEADRHEVEKLQAQLERRAVRKKRYYGDTFILLFDYDGHRHDVAQIAGKKNADRALARLKAVDALMEQRLARGEQPAAGPQAEWTEMPGGIPQNL